MNQIDKLHNGTGAAKGAGAFLGTGLGAGSGSRSGNSYKNGSSYLTPIDYSQSFGEVRALNYGYGNGTTAVDLDGYCDEDLKFKNHCTSDGKGKG